MSSPSSEIDVAIFIMMNENLDSIQELIKKECQRMCDEYVDCFMRGQAWDNSYDEMVLWSNAYKRFYDNEHVEIMKIIQMIDGITSDEEVIPPPPGLVREPSMVPLPIGRSTIDFNYNPPLPAGAIRDHHGGFVFPHLIPGLCMVCLNHEYGVANCICPCEDCDHNPCVCISQD